MERNEITKEDIKWVDKMLERVERLEKIEKLKKELGNNDSNKKQ